MATPPVGVGANRLYKSATRCSLILWWPPLWESSHLHPFPSYNHPHVLLIFTHEPSLWSRSSLDLQPQLPFTNIIAVLPLNVSKHLHLLSLYPVKHCSECGTFNAMMRYKNQQI